MKKVLALALALVMVLGLAVSAFATTAIVLEKESTSSDTDLVEIETLVVNGEDDALYQALDAGDYYFVIEDGEDYKDLAVEATGCVTAEIVKYDPEVFEAIPEVTYEVIKKKSGNTTTEAEFDYDEYDDACDYAEDANDAASKTEKYFVEYNEVYLVKVTVEENYTAAYKEGTVKVSGTKDKKAFSYSFDVISDVVIFGYEDVKDAAKRGYELDGSYKGYSDYMTAQEGYITADLDEVLTERKPKVVSTTEFRAIQGEDLAYESLNNNLIVTIKEVAAGQKGVNFSNYGFKLVDADGDEVNKNAVAIKFGFYGKQVIASDFEIAVETELDWFELRELFGKKLEEEDIITYYVLKDGKLYDQVTVDYKDVDYDEEVELTIKGKAGDTLGEYTVQLTAPAAEETEENPNTGAESVVSVVSALAVVAVASAAAVSLKK